MKKMIKWAKYGGAALAAAGSSVAMAIDTTAIGTSLTAAETDALSVGDLVIGVVAGLVVVSIVVGMVRHLGR